MLKKTLLISLVLLFSFFSNPLELFAEENQENIQQRINEYTQKLNELGKSKDTLANQIKYLDSQYELTALKITQTEASVKKLESEIDSLTVKIDSLDIYLNQLSSAFIEQISQNYKLNKKVPSLAMLFAANNLNSFFEQLKYITAIQKNSQNKLLSMETVRTTYDLQKQQKTEKQTELETLQKTLAKQKINLSKQKEAKTKLLEDTKNDEKKYQEMLRQARTELDAIEAVIAGRGKETEVKEVNAGDQIASVIEGKSCNSSGTHLHFMVKNNNSVQNPFNFLKSIDFVDYSGGDSFNPSGSWDWPLKSRIQFNQGFGVTWAVRNTWVRSIYSFHSGIDIYGSSGSVYAVHKGKLFRGSYNTSGCALKYVRVHDEQSHIDTLFLHVNYF